MSLIKDKYENEIEQINSDLERSKERHKTFDRKIEDMREENDSLTRNIIRYNESIESWRSKHNELLKLNALPHS